MFVAIVFCILKLLSLFLHDLVFYVLLQSIKIYVILLFCFLNFTFILWLLIIYHLSRWLRTLFWRSNNLFHINIWVWFINWWRLWSHSLWLLYRFLILFFIIAFCIFQLTCNFSFNLLWLIFYHWRCNWIHLWWFLRLSSNYLYDILIHYS